MCKYKYQTLRQSYIMNNLQYNSQHNSQNTVSDEDPDYYSTCCVNNFINLFDNHEIEFETKLQYLELVMQKAKKAISDEWTTKSIKIRIKKLIEESKEISKNVFDTIQYLLEQEWSSEVIEFYRLLVVDRELCFARICHHGKMLTVLKNKTCHCENKYCDHLIDVKNNLKNQIWTNVSLEEFISIIKIIEEIFQHMEDLEDYMESILTS
jgi:hypothetical protein